MWNLVFWIVILGIIGARIYHVIDFFEYYKNNPIEIFMIWKGGLGFYGAVVPAIATTIILLGKKEEQITYWLCNIGTTAPLAQAIGRLGNYFNQELFGKPTNLPWGIIIDSNRIPQEYINTKKFHPLFFYESLLDILLFIILLILWKRTKVSRKINFFIYLSGYALIRFLLEPLRISHWTINLISNGFDLNVTQLISIISIIVSIFFIKHDIHSK